MADPLTDEERRRLLRKYGYAGLSRPDAKQEAARLVAGDPPAEPKRAAPEGRRERIEYAFVENVCVGCLGSPGGLMIGWTRCDGCGSRVCGDCKKKSRGSLGTVPHPEMFEGYLMFRCPGCGAEARSMGRSG